MTNILNPEELHSNLLAQEAEAWSKRQNRSEEKHASEYLEESMQMLISQQNEAIKNELKKYINNSLLCLTSYQSELNITHNAARKFANDMCDKIINESGLSLDGLDGNWQPKRDISWDKLMEIMKQADSKFSLSREEVQSELIDINSITLCLENLLFSYFWENISSLFQESGYSYSYFCRDRTAKSNNKITIEVY